MIQVADEGRPSVEVGIFENRRGVIELEVAVNDTGIGDHGDREEKGTAEQWANRETIHGVVILHRALMVQGGL